MTPKLRTLCSVAYLLFSRLRGVTDPALDKSL